MRVRSHNVNPAIAVRTALAPSLLALALLVGCGSDAADDPEQRGPAAQARAELESLGLTAAEAECVVDVLGADVVVEASDLNALTEGAEYRAAAEACTDGS